MRVTMTESRQASPDGVHVVSLIAGESYDLPDYLARKYLERGLAVEESTKKAPAPENKAEAAPPENKAPARAPRRRSSTKGKAA